MQIEPLSPKGGEDMNKYEVLYIIDTELDEENRNALVERMKGIVEQEDQAVAVDEWGIRKLAYPIQKKTEGYYVKMNFSSGPEVPKELTRVFRITESVIRYLIVKEDE
jgi:small subunit ribosomal protein S6